jgi:hypothetical protein
MTAIPLEFQVRVDAQGPFRATLEMVTESIDVSSMNGKSVPNLAWEFVDEAGHYHAWTKSEDLPTLHRSVRHIECDHVHDDDEDECGGWDKITYACRICAEEVEPAYVTDFTPQLMAGRSYWEARVMGVHLEPGTKVSVSFSTPHDGRVRYFGVAGVLSNEITSTLADEVAYVSKLYGDGPLGRKR